MKLIIALIIVLLTTSSCAMGMKPKITRERKDQDKLWRPCQNFEAEKPVGKLCNRVCTKRTKFKKRCKSWKTNVRDFSKKEDFMFFRSGSFIMIDEDQIL